MAACQDAHRGPNAGPIASAARRSDRGRHRGRRTPEHPHGARQRIVFGRERRGALRSSDPAARPATGSAAISQRKPRRTAPALAFVWDVLTTGAGWPNGSPGRARSRKPPRPTPGRASTRRPRPSRRTQHGRDRGLPERERGPRPIRRPKRPEPSRAEPARALSQNVVLSVTASIVDGAGRSIVTV